MSTIELQLNKDLEWAIGSNRWSLKICGIWGSDNNSQWYKAISNLLLPLYALSIIAFDLYPQSFALVRVWGNLTLMVENFITYLPLSVALCKIVTMWFKREVIVTMMNFVTDDWSNPKSEREREVMIKYAHASRMITFCGYLVIAASVLAYHIPVIFGVVLRTLSNITDTGSRQLVLPSIYHFDVYETPIYELAVFTQFMGCSIAGFCYTTVSSLFGTIVLHVCSQLENLTFRFERMLKDDWKKSNNFQKIFVTNVKEHQRLIRFADMVESTFSIMLLMIVPSFVITFCVQGFQLISTVGDDVRTPMIQVFFCVVYMTFVGFVMFVYSLVGQVLASQSEEIQYAAYNCDWYNLRSKDAAQLILTIIRAQSPLQITAGKFIPLSLNTFASLLKTTAGYMSCLFAVKDQ